MFIKCLFDKKENKLNYYRDKDCFEKLCKKLKERAMKIINCGFTLKRVRDMTRTYSQMNLLVGQRLQDVNLMKRKINLIITEEKIRENLEELLTANVT